MKQIENLWDLEDAMKRGKAVFVNGWWCQKPISAAFMMEQHGTILLSMFRSGMYEYERKSHGKRNNRTRETAHYNSGGHNGV